MKGQLKKNKKYAIMFSKGIGYVEKLTKREKKNYFT